MKEYLESRETEVMTMMEFGIDRDFFEQIYWENKYQEKYQEKYERDFEREVAKRTEEVTSDVAERTRA
ncbi:MAG: hypothetical protein LUE87_10670, partial [Lachnospiraceae bacterium]|nr:hypothetical protein [Lachnospiraceae bacterium]